jgi:hypothetical protein
VTTSKRVKSKRAQRPAAKGRPVRSAKPAENSLPAVLGWLARQGSQKIREGMARYAIERAATAAAGR